MFSLNIAVKARIPEYIKELYDTDNFEKELTKEIEKEAMAKWEELAKATLGSTAEEYIASMRSETYDNKVVLKLDGTLSNMQEKGSTEFDMKPGLLKGKESVTIPIAHSSSIGGARGMISGPNPLPKRIDLQIKKQGLRRGDRFRDTSRRRRSYDKTYLHKTSMYSGLTKSSRAFAKQTGAGYVTFRKVSKRSDPSSWWHPGFEPLNLMEKVSEYVSTIYPDMLNKISVRK